MAALIEGGKPDPDILFRPRVVVRRSTGPGPRPSE
jgi:hypothetical protein